MEDSIINIPENKCSICFEENLTNQKICLTGCSHTFCKECLDKWLDRGNKSCPLCRCRIQYYKNNDINYRVIIHSNRNRNNTNNTNNTDNTEVVLHIVRQNYIMKYITLCMSFIMFIGYIYYGRIINDYNRLYNLYTFQINNNTVINNLLTDCYSQGDQTIYVNLLDDENNIKKCIIPLSSYYNCLF